MKKKNKCFLGIITILLVLVLMGGLIAYSKRKANYIDLTQFEPQGPTQMMGYAIQTVNGKNIVIDGGTKEDANQIEEYLKNRGRKVDAWFITHPHIDHAGAFEVISQKEDITIDKVYLSVEEPQWYVGKEPERQKDIDSFFEAIGSDKIKDKVIEPNIKDEIKIDNVTVTILGLKNPEITTGKNIINNSSMVFRIQVNQKRILFLGDTGVESSEKLLKNLSKEDLKADIVQVSHHGQNGATEELYKTINPEICLWPTPEWLWRNDINGQEDSGPWKTKETRSWMEKLKVKQDYIAKDGTHTIRIF